MRSPKENRLAADRPRSKAELSGELIRAAKQLIDHSNRLLRSAKELKKAADAIKQATPRTRRK